ncbi:histidine kinase [Bacillus sp. JJ1773]|uniref:sensor histidine kinase n=1 Tax=Bacillus sp. JJ1773 TaxID=3122965 RepID=UPI002FFDA081
MIFEKRFDILQKEASLISLEKELKSAQYYQLNQQIQPHFFFNALNTILSLARLDRKEDLVHSIEVLSKYFKYKYKTNRSLIPLIDELQYMNDYLTIQNLRFGSRLTVKQKIDESCLIAMSPPFLLQTLVENCFKHGIEKNSGSSELIININKIEDCVFVEVWNSGSFLSDIQTSSNSGYGLNNIKKRLKLLFPTEKVSLNLIEKNHGTSAIVSWPMKTDDNTE